MGLAPKAAKPGDDICTILGCESLMALRSKSSGQYQAVGECYLHGFMQGESLLGSLPGHIRAVYALWADSGTYTVAYLDIRQGEIQLADPRLKSSCYEMRSEHLMREGSNIRSFDLV